MQPRADGCLRRWTSKTADPEWQFGVQADLHSHHSVAVAVRSRAPILATLRKELPYQAFVNLVLLSAAPLVVVVMGRSVLLVLRSSRPARWTA